MSQQPNDPQPSTAPPADDLLPHSPGGGGGQPSTGNESFARTILETDLDQQTVEVVDNLISEEWVKSNLTDAEVHEQKWLTRLIKLEVEALHPPEHSIWQGETIAYARDNPDSVPGPGEDGRALEALSDKEQATLTQLIQAAVMRLTRSREMAQQETLRKFIQRSERVDLTEDDDGGLFS